MCEPHADGAEEILDVREEGGVVALVVGHRHAEQQRQVLRESEVLDQGDHAATRFLENTFVAEGNKSGIRGK